MLARTVLGAAAVLLGFLGGVQVEQVVAASGEPEPVVRAIDPSARADEVVREDCPRLPAAPPYPVNENGMTYGSGAGIDEDDPGPDLVAAYGSSGRCGFVRATDRPRPGTTLAEVRASPGPDGRPVPLYAQDGVTVIGTFRSGRP
ncbi:hypothetical protein EXE59_02455 [Nocardioides eburneiflavus]|uniref:Uncharacterized protein n=1 Tax=Nocardioides eburneiflavus TaxID=2518372 RepID=A0A4Z1BZ32_9ACTN|nr:hypothetical protein [Nocardioides eburneiflavus]TGN62934.1 hypothetical protein EXE59_02455 [Nocardioides eburneiflavus]